MSGGVALGAYQGGAYAALHARRQLWPAHIAGSSGGAVNGALIAGNAPEARLEALESFWLGVASDRWWRSLDLLFSCQTTRALRALERRQATSKADVLLVSYRAPAHEPGPQKLFDFSTASLLERWSAGRADMEATLAREGTG
jgi:hypothetical protein